jgi:hypothetical protein
MQALRGSHIRLTAFSRQSHRLASREKSIREALDAMVMVLLDVRHKSVEERLVTGVTLRVILHRQAEGIAPQSRLFDDIVVGAPGFHFQPIAEFVDALVVGAVHLGEAESVPLRVVQRMHGLASEAAVIRDVQLQGSAERDVEHLEAPADRKQRQLPPQCLDDDAELPCVPRGVRFLNQARIGHGLPQKALRDIEAAREQETMHLPGDRFGSRVP